MYTWGSENRRQREEGFRLSRFESQLLPFLPGAGQPGAYFLYLTGVSELIDANSLGQGPGHCPVMPQSASFTLYTEPAIPLRGFRPRPGPVRFSY